MQGLVILSDDRLMPTTFQAIDREVHLQGLALENRSPQIDGVLSALLAKLEKDKPSVNLGDDDKLHCENFAVRVFTRADKIDRAGHADKTTATTYYAASVFIEARLTACALKHASHDVQDAVTPSIWRGGILLWISMRRGGVVVTDGNTMQILRQFGELSPDLIDMQRYAAWKAGDIRKALREGRTPMAGAPASAANAEQDLLDELGLPSVPGMHLLKTKIVAQQSAEMTRGS